MVMMPEQILNLYIKNKSHNSKTYIIWQQINNAISANFEFIQIYDLQILYSNYFAVIPCYIVFYVSSEL